MNIHIRGIVEFEKILSQPWQPSIETTRTRMSVQQLLDTQESPDHLQKQLKTYIGHMDNMVHHLSKHHMQPLVQQPSFEWSVDDTIIHSPCWRIETILPRFALAMALAESVQQHVGDDAFKEARKALHVQEALHRECASKLALWSWKLPTLNQHVLQKQWHVAQADICKGMADLCMLCTGIQNQTATSAMYTVSQRALRHFARALATWPTKQSTDLMHVSEALRYYYSSDILWSHGSYGPSIHRLERWQHAALEVGPFRLLKAELDKVPFLAHERRQTNDGAYFDIVAAAPPLPAVTELIRTPESTDTPHPATTPSLDAADEVAPVHEVYSETQ